MWFLGFSCLFSSLWILFLSHKSIPKNAEHYFHLALAQGGSFEFPDWASLYHLLIKAIWIMCSWLPLSKSGQEHILLAIMALPVAASVGFSAVGSLKNSRWKEISIVASGLLCVWTGVGVSRLLSLMPETLPISLWALLLAPLPWQIFAAGLFSLIATTALWPLLWVILFFISFRLSKTHLKVLGAGALFGLLWWGIPHRQWIIAQNALVFESFFRNTTATDEWVKNFAPHMFGLCVASLFLNQKDGRPVWAAWATLLVSSFDFRFLDFFLPAAAIAFGRSLPEVFGKFDHRIRNHTQVGAAVALILLFLVLHSPAQTVLRREPPLAVSTSQSKMIAALEEGDKGDLGSLFICGAELGSWVKYMRPSWPVEDAWDPLFTKIFDPPRFLISRALATGQILEPHRVFAHDLKIDHILCDLPEVQERFKRELGLKELAHGLFRVEHRSEFQKEFIELEKPFRQWSPGSRFFTHPETCADLVFEEAKIKGKKSVSLGGPKEMKVTLDGHLIAEGTRLSGGSIRLQEYFIPLSIPTAFKKTPGAKRKGLQMRVCGDPLLVAVSFDAPTKW